MKKEISLASLIIIIDQITKYFIGNIMNLGESVTVIKDYFYITYHLNYGAAWGIFSGMQTLLVGITVIVVALLTYYLYKHPEIDKFARYGLVLYIAGACGNLIDRVRVGEVTDFLDVIIPIVDYDFPIFNVADISLVCGFGLIIIAILRENKNGK